ncbi:unnamed protein product [Dibothriocephalus latus]|uniref:Amino acid transporter n=1 Tax=Dibothriocephalus latus TaxID=60516 RepID=A0A3P7KZ27_DIBLA|nr:unnamed protein product [Dibothriocephalus latus]
MSSKKTADFESDSSVSFNDADEELQSENAQQKKGGCMGCLRENLFVILILIGVAVGFGIGFGVRKLNPSPVAITWIGVLLICIAFGLAARKAGDIGKAFLDFFRSLAGVVLNLVNAFLQCTPVGVAFMIASAILNVEDIKAAFAGLGMFVLTVTAGLGILFFLFLIVYGAFALRNPFPFLRYNVKAWFISFATTSPIVSLPEMFDGCDQYGVDQTVSRFSLPLTATLLASGPAVFISAAAIFVAQTAPEMPSVGTLVIIW